MDINKILSSVMSAVTVIFMFVALFATIHLAETTQEILRGIAIMLFFGILHIVTALKPNK